MASVFKIAVGFGDVEVAEAAEPRNATMTAGIMNQTADGSMLK